MGDTIRNDGYLGLNSEVALGLASATDNYGNRSSGLTLQCAGQQARRMGLLDWANLTEKSNPPILQTFSSVKHLPDGSDSPLQVLCHRSAASVSNASSKGR